MRHVLSLPSPAVLAGTEPLPAQLLQLVAQELSMLQKKYVSFDNSCITSHDTKRDK